MANVAYRDHYYYTDTAPGTLGMQTGDLILVLALGGASVTIPAGFTQIGSEVVNTYYAKLAYRIRQVVDGGNYPGWTNTAYWICSAWSGVDGTNPIVASSFAGYSADANIPLPSLTASGIAGDAGIYHIMSEGYDSFTPAANYTERLDPTEGVTIGDRAGLTASQSTSGTVVSDPATISYVGHIVARSNNTGVVWYDHEGVAPWSSIWRPGRA